jgi:hypothetical protein
MTDVAPAALRDLVGRASPGTFTRVPIDGVVRLSLLGASSAPLHTSRWAGRRRYLGTGAATWARRCCSPWCASAVTLAATVMIDRAWRRQRRVTRLLEMQAHTDALTGLANRRRFIEMAEAELARARRYDAPLSLLMLDIDHFKEVNDAHGHRAGDRVLHQPACLEVLRTVDVVGRGRRGVRDPAARNSSLGRRKWPSGCARRLRAAVAREEGVLPRVTVSSAWRISTAPASMF